jgi:hypothetical protein
MANNQETVIPRRDNLCAGSISERPIRFKRQQVDLLVVNIHLGVELGGRMRAYVPSPVHAGKVAIHVRCYLEKLQIEMKRRSLK